MRYLILIGIIFTFSCSTKMFVDKSKIVHEAEGYLFYYHADKILFIPSRDTSIINFLKDTTTKKGYLLQSACGVNDLKWVAQKLMVDMAYLDNKQEIFLPDSIYLTTTRFRYLSNKINSVDFNDTIEFKYQNKRYKIDASDNFYGEVLKVDGNAM